MEEIPEFNPMDFKILKRIGGGSFGSVKLVENVKTQKQYAAKEPNDIAGNSFQKEFQAYKKVENAAILSLLGYSRKNFKFKDKLTLFMGFMKNGSVKELIKNPNMNNKLMKYIILLGVSLGMKYLHSEGIIHRDLKPDNILLNDEMEPKICDFGESEISDKEFTEILMNNTKGTPLYMAPEILGSNYPYNYKVDVYAFSFFAYELITSKKPFYEIKNLTFFKLNKLVLKGERPNISIIEDDTIKNFLQKCWSQKPSERPSFLEIVDELMQDKFKESFGITDQKSIEKVNNYLNLFDEDLKSPNSKDALDVKKEADKGNVNAIIQYAQMLLTGYGAVMNKSEALKYYKKAVDLGDHNSMYLYAHCLRHGEGIEKNIEEAVKYYKMAASLGNSRAMINLAHMYRCGKEIPQNSTEAVKYYEQSISHGNINAMINLGYMMYYGERIPQNKDKGKFYLKKAADSGNNQAMYIYGKILYEEKKNAEAFVYLRMSAELGNVEAMRMYSCYKIFLYGMNFSDPDIIRYLKMAADHGDELSKDMCRECGITGQIEEYSEKKAQEIKEDADDGDIQSMLSYAKLCYSGEGVPQDKKEAAEYFKKAADLGESQAMFDYGRMLINGDGIPENKKKGMEYLQQCVLGQDINLLYSYGHLLRNGEGGLPPDKIEAANYLKMSAERGNDKAMFEYGLMLLAGEGIPKNEKEGLELIEKSAMISSVMMTEYGEMLQKGELVPVNKQLAAQYFKRAMRQDNFRATYLFGLMEINGDGVEMNRDDGIRLLKLSADKGIVDAMKAYAGCLIQSQNKGQIKEASSYIKKASEKGDAVSFFLFRHVFRRIFYCSDEEENKKKTNFSDSNENDCSLIKVNSYESYIFKNNQFIYLQNSTVPKIVSDEFLEILSKSSSFRGIQTKVIHQNDPNSTYTFYFLSSMDSKLVTIILNSILQKHHIESVLLTWNRDIFFNEKIIPPDVLNLLLEHLNGLNNIRGVVRNIFDRRQIASYILINPLKINASEEINASIQKLLLPKGMVFDKIKYPLEKDIVMNEDIILKNKNDFDTIVNEIKKIGIEPINIERNRLYLYGNYFIRKLFQTFSFICFNTENEKMEALNHINSIVYSSKKNVLKYKMDLHYGKIDDSAYPKNVRDNLVQLFQTFNGIQDIQEHVFSIENPVVRTYVGFDSLKHLKKAYNKFFHYIDILRYGTNPKIFLKKKNLIYMFIKDEIDSGIESIITKYFASDVQKGCIEYYGNRFHRKFSKLLRIDFFGFDGQDNYDKALNLLQNKMVQCSRYHEIKSFIKDFTDVPENYLFYESF